MSDISKDDKVVTPDGVACEVVAESGQKYKDWATEHGHWKQGELIKLSDPLKIRVNSEREARFVVEYAEDCGFVVARGNGEPYEIKNYGNVTGFFISPNKMKLKQAPVLPHELSGNKEYYDLNFADYDQWTAWVDYYAKEGECDHATEELIGGPCTWNRCDNCGRMVKTNHNDDSDSWDEPAPENEEWRRMFRQHVEGNWNQELAEKLSLEDGSMPIIKLLDYIDELESEIEDVKEERDELENQVNEWEEWVKGLGYFKVSDLIDAEEKLSEIKEIIGSK
jgi:hypothetical protein